MKIITLSTIRENGIQTYYANTLDCEFELTKMQFINYCWRFNLWMDFCFVDAQHSTKYARKKFDYVHFFPCINERENVPIKQQINFSNQLTFNF